MHGHLNMTRTKSIMESIECNNLREAEAMSFAVPHVADASRCHVGQCVDRYRKAFLALVDRYAERTNQLPRLVTECAERSTEFTRLAGSGFEPQSFTEGKVFSPRAPGARRGSRFPKRRGGYCRARSASAFAAGRRNKHQIMGLTPLSRWT